MDYRVFNDKILLRLDPGEEVCESLLELASKENIALAEITGLGAASEFVIGLFDTEEKKYFSNTFKGKYEITSLVGTITSQEGKPFLHVHMNARDPDGNVCGGHLSKAVISATAEIVISVISGKAEREFNEEIGSNLIKF